MSNEEQLEELITGVKVISKEEEKVVTAIVKRSNLLAFASTIITTIVAVVWLFALFFTGNLIFLIGFLVVIGILIANVLISKPIIITEVGTGDFKYTVIVEDTVNFNEFNRRFEVVTSDSELYTIKIKKDSEEKL